MSRGRKAKSWLDVRVGDYAPNTMGALGLVELKGNTSLIQVTKELINLQDSDPSNCPAVAACRINLRFTCWDVLSRKFNIVPPFPLVDDLGKPLKARTLKYIRMFGAEATALFNLVSDVYAVRAIAGFSSAAEVWAALMLEGLPKSGHFRSEHSEGLTKQKAVDEYNAHSGALAQRNNPFGPGTAHNAFFQVACLYAQQATGQKENRLSIYARSFRPYLAARAELIDYISSKKSKTKMLKKQNRRI